MRGPAFAVDPGAVQFILRGGLAQLRDHEPVNVRAERGSLARVGLAIGREARPFGVAAHGFTVPDAGEMNEQGDAASGGFGSPDGERIADDAGGGGTDLGGPTEPAGVAFGIVLDEVWTDAVEEASGGFGRDIPSKHGVFFIGVQVEMQAEIALGAAQAPGLGLARERGCGQEGGEAAAGEVCHSHRRYNIGF